jgi:hypothetical protein
MSHQRNITKQNKTCIPEEQVLVLSDLLVLQHFLIKQELAQNNRSLKCISTIRT